MVDINNKELKNIIEELNGLATKDLKPVALDIDSDIEVEPKLDKDGRPLECLICRKLEECDCQQYFGEVTEVDAATEYRRVKFSIEVKNLCKNKEYIVSVILYKWVWCNRRWVKVSVGQDCKIAKYCGPSDCGCDTVYFELAIKEPLCSDKWICFDIVSNYVDGCYV